MYVSSEPVSAFAPTAMVLEIIRSLLFSFYDRVANHVWWKIEKENIDHRTVCQLFTLVVLTNQAWSSPFQKKWKCMKEGLACNMLCHSLLLHTHLIKRSGRGDCYLIIVIGLRLCLGKVLEESTTPVNVLFFSLWTPRREGILQDNVILVQILKHTAQKPLRVLVTLW